MAEQGKPKLDMNKLKGMKLPIKAALALAAVVGGGTYLFNNCLFNVEGGHRAVMYNRLTGVRNEVIEEGTHFRFPWFDRPILYDVRSRPRNISSLTGSRDLQMVNITIRVLSKPNVSKLPDLYRTLGLDYDERVLPSIVHEVLKSVVAQFNASQLITQREQVSRLIRRNLVERATEFMIDLDDVSITHLSFSKEYTAAVEAKQVAQQDAERAKFVVDKAMQDKKSTIIRADGEARAARMIGEAVRNNPGFLQLRKIEAAREVANTISQAQNKVFLNADSLLLNLVKEQDTTTMPSGLTGMARSIGARWLY